MPSTRTGSSELGQRLVHALSVEEQAVELVNGRLGAEGEGAGILTGPAAADLQNRDRSPRDLGKDAGEQSDRKAARGLGAIEPFRLCPVPADQEADPRVGSFVD